jgi:hypothetical protein
LQGIDFQVAPLGRANDDQQRSAIFQQQAIQVKGDYAQQNTHLAQGNSWVDVGWFQ